jgi:hypothetical protein
VSVQEQVHRHRRQRLLGVKASHDQHGHRRPHPSEDFRGLPEGVMSLVTFLWVAVYLPVETYVSWTGLGVFRFSYLVDLVGIGLLATGAWAAWRGRGHCGALLATGWAWTAANFWRGTMDRYATSARGLLPWAHRHELWIGPLVTVVAIAAVAASLWIAIRATAERD